MTLIKGIAIGVVATVIIDIVVRNYLLNKALHDLGMM